MVTYRLSRINDGKFEELPINNYFPADFLKEGSSSIKKELEEAIAIAKYTVLWYVDYINYLVVGVLPLDLTYQQKKIFFHAMKQYY